MNVENDTDLIRYLRAACGSDGAEGFPAQPSAPNIEADQPAGLSNYGSIPSGHCPLNK